MKTFSVVASFAALLLVGCASPRPPTTTAPPPHERGCPLGVPGRAALLQGDGAVLVVITSAHPGHVLRNRAFEVVQHGEDARGHSRSDHPGHGLSPLPAHRAAMEETDGGLVINLVPAGDTTLSNLVAAARRWVFQMNDAPCP